MKKQTPLIVRKLRRRGRKLPEPGRGIAAMAWENASLGVRKEILFQGRGTNVSMNILVHRPWSALSLWAKKAVRRYKRRHR